MYLYHFAKNLIISKKYNFKLNNNKLLKLDNSQTRYGI